MVTSQKQNTHSHYEMGILFLILIKVGTEYEQGLSMFTCFE